MLVGGEALDEHVIHIYLNRLTEVFGEHSIHQSLVHGACFFGQST